MDKNRWGPFLTALPCLFAGCGFLTANPAFTPETRFLFLTKVGALVAGGTVRSCSYYLGGSGVAQVADEETDGTLHGLREGKAGTDRLLRRLSRDLLAARPRREGKPSEPMVTEYYGPRLTAIWLSPAHGYLAEGFDAPAVPPGLANLVHRVETDLRAADLPSSPAGLYARARRLPDFDPSIESLHATVSPSDLGMHPLLAELVAREMALVRLGPSGKPAVLTGAVQAAPGRAVRIQVGDLTYLVQAYDLAGSPAKAGERCP
jgi:hypothetical protein